MPTDSAQFAPSDQLKSLPQTDRRDGRFQGKLGFTGQLFAMAEGRVLQHFATAIDQRPLPSHDRSQDKLRAIKLANPLANSGFAAIWPNGAIDGCGCEAVDPSSG